MAIDFEIPEEAKAVRALVRQWVQDECIPAEKELHAGRDYKELLGELRTKARARGLWLPFIPKEYGGMGLGPLANALVQMELGQSHLGALSMNSQGPDDATMLTLRAHGTDFQKEKYLKPLLNGEKRVCYSMTEKAAGADATGMRTTAVKDGNENYVLNGEKWFSSAASAADLAVVMARTDPDAPRHQQFSTFIVELPNPGYNIKRDIKTMAVEGPLSHIMGGGHSEIEIKDLLVPAENLLGGEGQGVQFMLAECASELYMARLMLLHIAYKAEKGMDLRQENSIAKVFLAHMVHKVVDTAIQLHGALGYSQDTPLASWYTHIRSQRLVDGPDEVHRWTVGRNVIKAYQQHGTTASAAGGDLI